MGWEVRGGGRRVGMLCDRVGGRLVGVPGCAGGWEIGVSAGWSTTDGEDGGDAI